MPIRTLDSKTRLMKTLHTLVTGHGETKPVLTLKPPPCGLAFTVPEDAIQAVREEQWATVLHNRELQAL